MAEVVRFKLRPLYPRRKNSNYPSNSRPDGTRAVMDGIENRQTYGPYRESKNNSSYIQLLA
jgi:hypothetical protein